MSELIFSSSSPAQSYRISTLLKKKEIRKIAGRIYTSNLDENPALIIRRNILEILGALYPNAVLSHRSAFEFRPTETGKIFVTYLYTKKITLPGVTIQFIRGKGALPGDNKLIGELFVSSEPRRFLENLQITKKSGPDSKSIGAEQIEIRLDDILRIKGESALNELRDKARVLSVELNFKKEYSRLDNMIGALLKTRSSSFLKSEQGLFRSHGLPYDRLRLEVFEILFRYLYNKNFPSFPEKTLTPESFRNTAFFEAFFSNYIEGTVFEISEAKEIIDTGVPLPARSGDSHDILGTYSLVSDRKEMNIIPNDPDDLIAIIKRRHSLLMKARTEKEPGKFKATNNRAGNTYFVEPGLVEGTLKRGFNYLRVLEDPFARAAYMKFLISEVHPFSDGNGRIARIMMNAELVAAKQSKILVPNVYRDDYLLTLKKLSRDKDPGPYVEMLLRAWKFSSALSFVNYNDMFDYLKTHNAFEEPGFGKRLLVDS